jgi:hypothetical protein
MFNKNETCTGEWEAIKKLARSMPQVDLRCDTCKSNKIRITVCKHRAASLTDISDSRVALNQTLIGVPCKSQDKTIEMSNQGRG